MTKTKISSVQIEEIFIDVHGEISLTCPPILEDDMHSFVNLRPSDVMMLNTLYNLQRELVDGETAVEIQVRFVKPVKKGDSL